MVKRTYKLAGKYLKMFEAHRGKYVSARSMAIHKDAEHETNFETWSYSGTLGELTITWKTAPSYLQEDELFDFLEAEHEVYCVA